MKIITEKETNLSKFIYSDEHVIDSQEDKIVILKDEKEVLIIGCHNSGDTVVFNSDLIPEDWTGNKYFYTEQNGFELNPEWIDPDAPVVEEQ